MRTLIFVIGLCLIAFLIGFIWGYQYGTYKAIDWAVDKAIKEFINDDDIQKANNIIKFGVYYYKNKIDSLDYALILNNTGN